MPILLMQIWLYLLVLPIAVRWVLGPWKGRRRVARVRRALRVLSLAGALLMALGLRPFVLAFVPVYPLAFVLLTALPAALGAWPRAESRERLARAVLGATVVLALGLGIWAVPFNQQYSFRDDCAPMIAERRNHLLTSICQPDWEPRIRAIVGAEVDLNPATQGRTIFPAPDPRFVYTACGLEGSFEKAHPLLRVDRATGAIDRSYVTSAVFDGSCDSETARCIVVLSAESRYLVLDDRSGAVVHQGALPVGPRFVAVHAGTAIVGLAGLPGFARVDLTTGAVAFPEDDEVLLLAALAGGGGVACIGAEPGRPETFFAFEYPAPTFRSLMRAFTGRDPRLPDVGSRRGPLGRVSLGLDRFDVAPLTLLDRVMSLDLAISTIPDSVRNELLVVTPMQGAVLAHDLDTLAFRWRLQVGAGARMADVDRRRGRLYVGNYASGWVSVVDLGARKVIDRIFVGRVIRQLRVDPSTGHLFTASRAGFVEVDPERAEPNPGTVPDSDHRDVAREAGDR